MEKHVSQPTPWKRFLGLLALERKDIVQIFYYSVFSGMVALSLPLGIQVIVNLIQGAQISTSWIVMVILVTLGVIFSGTLDLMQIRIIETLQQRIFVRSSFEFSYRFPKIKMEALRNTYPPELANRFFDTLSVQKGLSKALIEVPSALLQIVFALILLSLYHPLFIVFGLVLLTSMYIVFQGTARKGLQTSLVESKYKYKEVARSIISFKLSGKTSLALRKNDNLVSSYIAAREAHFSILKLQFVKMVGFKAIITAGLLVIGGVLVLNQQMNIGQFVAAEIVILLVIASVEKLILGLENLYDMLTSIEKLGQVVDKPLEAQEGEVINASKGLNIELEDVCLRTTTLDKPILENISLNINQKSRILLEGESGSGKSTLLRIITGLISPTSGHMNVNGISITGLQLNKYRSHLGISFSEEFPFEGTYRENFTFGDSSITDEAIFDICEKIGLADFIKKLPNGLSTTLYPEGKQVPYTIAKKIVLARTILKQPKLIILEDSLGSFDEEECKSIIDFLCDPSQPWALIVVSSKSYWKTYCKEIVTLKEGKIQSK